jgi:hypothetical protein
MVGAIIRRFEAKTKLPSTQGIEMSSHTAASYSQALQEIVEKYRKARQPWPATSRQIADWARRKRLWQPQEKNIIGQLARDISRAMREEYYTDPQGRRVRTKHAARMFPAELPDNLDVARELQGMLWADIRTDDPDHIALAFQQRRMQIVGDCKQLKTDMESFNDNHPSGKNIQMIFNFEDDLTEMDMPTEYQPRQYDSGGSDD